MALISWFCSHDVTEAVHAVGSFECCGVYLVAAWFVSFAGYCITCMEGGVNLIPQGKCYPDEVCQTSLPVDFSESCSLR